MSRAMARVKSSKREYNSSRRQAQASETRTRILQAARKLFIERGYAGATGEAIAAEAGVALQTIYAIFKNKKRILVSLPAPRQWWNERGFCTGRGLNRYASSAM